MAQDQVVGELTAHLFRYGHGGKVAEAGGDAVGHAVFPHDLFRQIPGLSDRLPRRVRQLHRSAEAGHGHKAVQRERMPVQGHLRDGFRMLHKASFLFSH